jgi:hypothetical protein
VWREFADLVAGLLASKSRLGRAVSPAPDEETTTTDEGVMTFD